MARGTVIKRDGRRLPYRATVELPAHPGTGQRRRKSRSFATRREADKWLTDTAAAVGAGVIGDAGKLTVSEYLDQWEASLALAVKVGDLRSNTATWYGGAARHIRAGIGAVKLGTLDAATVEAFYADLTGTVSASTLNWVHRTLRKALGSAVRRGLLRRNPLDGLDHRPRAAAAVNAGARANVWTPEQLRAFLAAVAENRLAAAFRLAAVTGMRRGEVLGLHWADVELDAGHADVRQAWIMQGGSPVLSGTKTGRERRVLLDAGTVAAMRAWRRRQLADRLAWGEGWQSTGFVFTREDGRPVRPDYFSRMFGRLVAAAGLPKLTPHGLRHTAASFHLEAGTPLTVVSEMLGHQSTRLTADIYSHVLPRQHQAAVDQLGAALDA